MLRETLLRHLDRSIALAEREVERNREDDQRRRTRDLLLFPHAAAIDSSAWEGIDRGLSTAAGRRMPGVAACVRHTRCFHYLHIAGL